MWWARSNRSGERGATAIEYALIGMLIGVVCIGSLTALGNSAVGMFGTIGGAMAGGASGTGGVGAGNGVSAGGGFGGAAGGASGGSGLGGSFF